jgi:hypothetical protein
MTPAPATAAKYSGVSIISHLALPAFSEHKKGGGISLPPFLKLL